MPTQVQFRRGTTTQNESFTGAVGELSVDTTLDTVRVHDGSTAGGIRLAKYSEIQAGDITAVVAGTGLSGGATSGSATVNLSHLGLESLSDPNDDQIIFWDDSAGATAFLDLGTGLSISGTTVSVGTLNQDTTGNAGTFTVSANDSTDETVYPVFVDGATGSQGAESDTGLTYNPSSGLLTTTLLAGTLNTAAQTNITSVGTLTALTVDNVVIDGAVIGHTGDTDLITLSSGVVTVAGEVDATSLDVSGDADIDGTLEADAITVGGSTLESVVEGYFSATDAGGDGSFSYSNGVYTYTGPSAAEVRAHITAGTGVAISSGQVSIGQAVATSSDVTFADVAATGNVTITGNLDVNGTTTTLDTTNSTIADRLIELGNGTTGTPANDMGIVLERGSSDNVLIGWDESTDNVVVGTGSFTGASTGDLTYTAANFTAGVGTFSSLDISGNADVDGTMEADAYTVDGTALNEYIADTVGAMVSSNTESGITVAYEDGDNTLDFTVGTLNQDTTGNAATADVATLATSITASANNTTDETVYLTFVDGATGTQGIETDTGLTYNPSSGALSVENADAGSSAGPVLTLYRNSASPADADYLGQIKFSGEDDGGATTVYSKITGKAGDVTDGTEDGIIEFAAQKAGTSTILARLTSTKLALLNSTYLEGNVTGNLTGNADTATALATARTLSFTGDVTGTGDFDGSGNLATALTIAANSVALGTDTTGNYMAQVSGGDGITISHTQGEGSTATITGTAIYNASGTKLN